MGFNKPRPPFESLAWNKQMEGTIRVQCLRFGHTKHFQPHQLLRYMEWGDQPQKFRKLFKCIKCKTKGEVQVT